MRLVPVAHHLLSAADCAQEMVMFLSLVPVEDCLHFAVEQYHEMVLKDFDVLLLNVHEWFE